MPDSHRLGTVIRTYREAKYYSQEYMAEMLGISQSAYANLENGKSVLSIDRLLRITEVLQLDIHDVIEHSIRHRYGKPPFNETQRLNPETKEAYDLLISELRNEVRFLRSLIKKEVV